MGEGVSRDVCERAMRCARGPLQEQWVRCMLRDECPDPMSGQGAGDERYGPAYRQGFERLLARLRAAGLNVDAALEFWGGRIIIKYRIIERDMSVPAKGDVA